MRFAIINASGKAECIYEDHKSAKIEFDEMTDPGDGWTIKPIMTIVEWGKLPRDYRGYLNGRPAVLYHNSINGYTVYGYVYLIEDWNEVQPDVHIHATYDQLVIPNLVLSPT